MGRYPICATTIVALLTISPAHAQESRLLFDQKGFVLDQATGTQHPAIFALGGVRPADCPEDAYWVGSFQDVGTLVTDCLGTATYLAVHPAEPGLPEGVMALKPLPPQGNTEISPPFAIPDSDEVPGE
jgi:hypothetical protein